MQPFDVRTAKIQIMVLTSDHVNQLLRGICERRTRAGDRDGRKGEGRGLIEVESALGFRAGVIMARME